jgi:hypothetical protein
LGRNLRFDLWFLWNALLINEKFFIPFRAETWELPLEVGKDDTLIPNFLLQLSRFLLQRLPANDFIRDLEGGRELILEVNEFI